MPLDDRHTAGQDTDQGGLSGLAWPGDDDHWIAAGEVLKPGFRVSGDVGHDGFCLLSMPALWGNMANCQSDYRSAILLGAAYLSKGENANV